MLLTEFQNLPFGYQIELLFQDGIPLLSHSARWEERVLFSYHTYYVEAGWDEDGHLQFIRPSTNLAILDPYLAQLNWRELA